MMEVEGKVGGKVDGGEERCAKLEANRKEERRVLGSHQAQTNPEGVQGLGKYRSVGRISRQGQRMDKEQR
jgi:hypothetical protein